MNETLHEAISAYDTEAEFFVIVSRSKDGKLHASIQVPDELVEVTADMLKEIIGVIQNQN